MGSDDSSIFSFSFNAEILSFFGGAVDSISSNQVPELRQTVSTKVPIFQAYFLDQPRPDARSRILSFFHYTVATTGVLLVVGVGSYYAYSFLQRIRNLKYKSYSGKPLLDFSKVKHRFLEERLRWSRSTDDTVNEDELEESPRELADLAATDSDANGKRATNGKFRQEKGEIVTSGAEQDEDIQTEYFGPALDKSDVALNSEDIDDLMDAFRDSPNPCKQK